MTTGRRPASLCPPVRVRLRGRFATTFLVRVGAQLEGTASRREHSDPSERSTDG